jgi:two-component system sensor histidine kinase UhpB
VRGLEEDRLSPDVQRPEDAARLAKRPGMQARPWDGAATIRRMPPTAPLDLPRLVMRRAGLLGAAVLALALLLGLARMNQDIGEEVDAAMALATVMGRLGQLGAAGADDAQVLAALRGALASHPLRHLALQVDGADGRPLLAPPPAAPVAAPLRWLLALHRDWLSAPDARRVAWPVPRPDGSRWTVTLAASHDSERREAMASLLGMLGLLLLGLAGLLLVMHWNLRLALAPLGRLLQAIAGIEGRDARAVQALPPMPITELESLAAALRHLGAALDDAEARRRQLARQVLTLQDDERARLARELHDEFGQRLTALRVDAAWLSRRLARDATLQAVADGMAQQCALVQHDIRQLLARLQPFGPASPDTAADTPAAESLAHGLALLQALVASWRGSGSGHDLECRLDLAWTGADGQARPWPDDEAAQALCLPRALWLTLYRISQEALTNVARHADAGTARLQLAITGEAGPGAAVAIDWSVTDDGRGMPAAGAAELHGNGIAGIRQRAWSHGADLQLGPAVPGTGAGAGAARPGFRLAAHFSARWLAPTGDTADSGHDQAAAAARGH